MKPNAAIATHMEKVETNPLRDSVSDARALRTMDWGRLAYDRALEKQRELNLLVSRDEAPETLIFVEHEPVITVSHRKGADRHVLASPEQLEQLGLATAETDRGGDVTYHGPGQLVAYPILRLDRHRFNGQRLNLTRYMRLLEDVVIGTLGAFGVVGLREPGATGVWVATLDDPDVTAKIAALGVRVRKHTTMHGLALNVTTDLSHFETIDPCGLGGRPVTSLHELLGERCPAMDVVKKELSRQFDRALAPVTN